MSKPQRRIYRVEIDTENAAFTGERWSEEIPRILREIADRFPKSGSGHNLRDCNGNPVGYAGFALTTRDVRGK